MSLIMMSIVLLVGNLQMNKVLLLIIQVLIGGTIYMGMSLVLKNKNFVILKDYIVLYVRK